MKTFIFLSILYIVLLFSILAFGQQQIIQVTFNEKMDRQTLFDVNNWQLFDENFNEISIAKIAVVPPNDSIAILFTEFLSYKTNFNVRVRNVKDAAGNLISPSHDNAWFYLDGFDSGQQKPKLIFVK